LRAMVASRPKVSFCPDGSTSLEIMDGSFYIMQAYVFQPSKDDLLEGLFLCFCGCW
jgi:hypothetical protein